jgi:predicted ATPase
LIDYVLRTDRRRYEELVRAVCARVPGLVDINIRTPEAGSRRVDIRIDSGVEMPADSASVGVRLVLFFVALTYHPAPPALVLIEEPENGVHPRRLADIMKLLRDITKGVHCGHPAQVILTTHSPYLLDHVNLDEDEVLVFRRNDDGSRTCEPVDAERLKTFLGEFMLGEVWFNEQEEGLIKRGT